MQKDQRDSATERIRLIPLAAMFTALGVLVPQVFHWFGLGSMFLPMFLPVLAAAMLLPRGLACTVALLTPTASFMLTGMPPLSPPVLPLLLAELTAAAFTASSLRVHLGRSVLLSLAAALIVDRLLLFVLIHAATELAGIQHPLFGTAMVLAGLPGIILLLTLIPSTMALINARFPRFAATHERER